MKELKTYSDSATNWTPMVGEVTAAALAAMVGEASDYGSAGAFLKALGLNLRTPSTSNAWKELGASTCSVL